MFESSLNKKRLGRIGAGKGTLVIIRLPNIVAIAPTARRPSKENSDTHWASSPIGLEPIDQIPNLKPQQAGDLNLVRVKGL